MIPAESPRDALVLLAAGSGRRMGGTVADKILAPLAGRPAVAWSAEAFLAALPQLDWYVVARDEAQRLRLEQALRPAAAAVAAAGGRWCWVHGGAERADSVAHALARIPAETRLVLVHDAARPLVEPRDIVRCVAAAATTGAAVLARRVTDTIREVVEPDAGPGEPIWTRTPDRRRLWAMETPQVLAFVRYATALSAARARGLPLTDDASAWEAAGHSLVLVESSAPNPKLTTPDDLVWIEHLIAARGGAPRA